MIDCWQRTKLEMLFAVIVLLNTCTVFITKVRQSPCLHLRIYDPILTLKQFHLDIHLLDVLLRRGSKHRLGMAGAWGPQHTPAAGTPIGYQPIKCKEEGLERLLAFCYLFIKWL